MKRKKFVLTDLNHRGATHFSTLCGPCLGRDPYFGNRCAMGRDEGSSSVFGPNVV